MPYVMNHQKYPIHVTTKAMIEYDQTLAPEEQHDHGQTIRETRINDWANVITYFSYEATETHHYITELECFRPTDHRHRLCAVDTYQAALEQHEYWAGWCVHQEARRDKETSPTAVDVAALIHSLNHSNRGRAAIRLASQLLEEPRDEKKEHAIISILNAGWKTSKTNEIRELLRQLVYEIPEKL